MYTVVVWFILRGIQVDTVTNKMHFRQKLFLKKIFLDFLLALEILYMNLTRSPLHSCNLKV